MIAGQGFAELVTLQNIDEYRPMLRTQEAGRRSTRRRAPKGTSGDTHFQGIRITFSHPFFGSRRGLGQTTGTPDQSPSVLAVMDARGPLVWRKILAASDVGRQQGRPTCVVRLGQAKFQVNGNVIDHTVYFRKTLFGDFGWTVTQATPRKEEALVSFDLHFPRKPELPRFASAEISALVPGWDEAV